VQTVGSTAIDYNVPVSNARLTIFLYAHCQNNNAALFMESIRYTAYHINRKPTHCTKSIINHPQINWRSLQTTHSASNTISSSDSPKQKSYSRV